MKKTIIRKYPHWICAECGNKFGSVPKDHVATFHYGICGWCKKENVAVTQPRDYGYPDYKADKCTSES